MVLMHPMDWVGRLVYLHSLASQVSKITIRRLKNRRGAIRHRFF